MKKTPLAAGRKKKPGTLLLITLAFLALFLFIPFALLLAQCGTGSGFTKITNTSGTVSYPATNGNSSVSVTTTSTGDAGVISFCNITNGFRAGLNDRSGSFRFAFSSPVNGILINLNALSNTPDVREVVRIKINNAFYNITAANLACSATCFGCSGTAVSAVGGALTAASSLSGNGAGQLLIQSVGPISSIEYINEVQLDEPQGSVFEIFFNNSTCILPMALTSFTATAFAAGTQLRWTALAQVNLRFYQPERSTDGVNFTAITHVPANASGSYQYTDMNAPAGTNYYRLKMIDRDNSYAFSSIVTATTTAGNKMILFIAANNTLTIKGLSGNNIITVHTITGNKLVEIMTGRQLEMIDATRWPAGLYVVKVINNGKAIASEKVLKQ